MSTALMINNTNAISDILLSMPLLGLEYKKVIADETSYAGFLNELRKDIGDKLFYSLSDKDKKFIIETEGIVDFGYKLTDKDMERIEKSLREDCEY